MISLINVETRLAGIAERVRDKASQQELEAECSLLQKDLQRAAKAIYASCPNYTSGRIETRVGRFGKPIVSFPNVLLSSGEIGVKAGLEHGV